MDREDETRRRVGNSRSVQGCDRACAEAPPALRGMSPEGPRSLLSPVGVPLGLQHRYSQVLQSRQERPTRRTRGWRQSSARRCAARGVATGVATAGLAGVGTSLRPVGEGASVATGFVATAAASPSGVGTRRASSSRARSSSRRRAATMTQAVRVTPSARAAASISARRSGGMRICVGGVAGMGAV